MAVVVVVLDRAIGSENLLLLAVSAAIEVEEISRSSPRCRVREDRWAELRQMTSFSWSVLRPLDMLAVRFEFFNLLLVRSGPAVPRLVREQPGEEAVIVVHFPPQHTAEAVATGADFPSMPMLGRVAGASRLAFRLRSGVDHLPFTLEALFDWTSVEPNLVPVAQQRRGTVFEGLAQAPPLRPPAATETAIELPYRLVLSPHPGGGWAHSVQPVTHEGRTELWHTRLGVVRTGPDGAVFVDEEQAGDRYVRAVLALEPLDSTNDIGTTLTAQARSEIVTLSGDFAQTKDGVAYRPDPIEIDRLMLSARGGWIRAHGDWDGPVDLRQWQHVATQGRDHYVRTVEEGLLYPFGHRAALVTISERVVERLGGQDGAPVAVLRQRKFIVVREPVKTYQGEAFPHGSHEMPFARELRIVTLSMPIGTEDVPESHGALWVMKEPPPLASSAAAGGPALFHLVGTDSAGTQSDLQAAMIFVPRSVSNPDPHDPILGQIFLRAVATAYADTPGDTPDGRRRITLNGARIAYAPPADPAQPGDTTLVTSALTFSAHLIDPAPGPQPALPFLPFLESAQVHIPAIEQLAGTTGDVKIGLAQAFLSSDLDAAANPAQLFAEVAPDTSLNLALPAERGAALARPDLTVRGLSRSLGPVAGDLGQLTLGVFDASSFFAESAKLLGAVSVGDLVAEVFSETQFPRMLSHTTPDAVVAAFDWEPKIADDTKIVPLKSRPPGISLKLHTRLERPLNGDPTRSSVSATLSNFTFSFAGVLEAHFDALSFRSENGGQPIVSADLADEGIVFDSPLEFLNIFRDFIPSDGFSDPPALAVSPSGVTVGYSLALPALPLGVFELENVRLGASLNLPFRNGLASLRFNFAERHDEFLLTVEGLGGGGYFALALGLDGIEMIEASLEFGAAVALDFGVASGSVSVMAGIYFHLETKQTECSGYLRMHGEVEVLGLVSVSLEVLMSLRYIDEAGSPHRIEGVATVVLKIDLTLFSKAVEFTVRRSFAQSAGDPSFGDVMPEADDWARYASCFA
ncbi:hypothetical protein [Kitasatospora sp. NPDC097691]|uniref:hypothetical protein n=1 Tax=Kitasatospora sp. NPDC097691 TaxID=3157231 RepID=UPI00332EE5FC